MAEEFKGLTQEQLDKLDQYKVGTSEIYESYKALNAELKKAGFEQDKLTKNQFVGRDITSKIAQLQKEAVSTTDAARKLEVEKNSQLVRAAKLEARRTTLLGKAAIASEEVRKIYLKQAENLTNSADQARSIADAIKETQQDVAKLDQSSKFFSGLSSIVGDIPGLRKLSGPFDAAAKASKEAVLSNAKLAAAGKETGIGPMRAGMAGFGKSLMSAFNGLKSMTGVFGIIIGLFKLLVGSAKRHDELTIKTAKTYGVTRDTAAAINTNLQATTGFLTKGVYTSEEMLEAYKQLNEVTGAVRLGIARQAMDQATLTNKIGMSGDAAGYLNLMLENQGLSAKEVFDNVNDTANAQAKQNGFLISAKKIFNDIGQVSASIAANFANNIQALGEAVLQTRKFGLSLGQAASVADNLLDFQTSLSSELKAEILLGKQFNFERARALAISGDIAGATAEVMKQMEGLNDEQLKSPIIQKAIASATGLSADEFLRAREVTKALSKDQKNLQGLLDQAQDDKTRRAMEDKILQGATFDQLKQNMTAQAKYNVALTNAKDQFAELVGSGYLQMFASILPNIIKGLGYLTGSTGKLESQERLRDEVAELGKRKRLTEEEIAAAQKKAATLNQQGGFKNNTGARRKITNQVFNVDDFTLKSNPKDTLVMAGGTKFGKETNGLLRQLISAVEGGKVINLEGRKVGETLVMSSYKS